MAAVAGGLALAGLSGFFVAAAVGQAGEPARTVTVNVGGPGPPGPPGLECIEGYSPGILVLNAPGGQVKTFTCLEDNG